VLAGALLLGACATPSSTAQAPPLSSATSASFAATPSPLASQTSSITTRTFAVDPVTEWPVILYEADGAIVRQRTEAGAKEIARPCGEVAQLEARPAGLLAWCTTATIDSEDLRLVAIPDGRVTTVLASNALRAWPADVSPDGRSVAMYRLGDCPMPAPVCQTRIVLIDLADHTERELLPSGYHLGSTLEWTALGLTFFQPECAESGCVSDVDRRGTFVWDGSAFKRWSDLRFVASAGSWTLLERVRSLSDRSDQRAAVIRGPQGERTLSAGHALAITATGEALVWVPGPQLLMRFASDGHVLWQASIDGTVLKMIGPDAFLAASPASKIEIYDVKRMLRFTPAPVVSWIVAGVAR
jgi:hypothetical protein